MFAAVEVGHGDCHTAANKHSRSDRICRDEDVDVLG
jgi:hypothetical protein